MVGSAALPLRARRLAAGMIDPAKYATATIVSRSELSEDLWVIRLTADCELPFRSGQYVTLGLPRNGRVIERPYSISSSPEDAEIELFIERVPEGEFSAPLYELGVGAEMVVRRRCKGLFMKGIDLDSRDALFVATVTGVAPFVSLVRLFRDRQKRGEWDGERRVIILLGASFPGELGYGDELAAYAAECPWLSVIPTISRPWDDGAWSGETGRVEDILRKHADGQRLVPSSASAYLCGNPEMIKNARGILRRRGFAQSDIHEEQYWPE